MADQLKNFKRTVGAGDVVMESDNTCPRTITPGPTTIGNLAPPNTGVVPRSTVVHGVRWVKKSETEEGKLMFPANFSGEIETDVATPDTLEYYGARLANHSKESIDVKFTHNQTTFTYHPDYLSKYVEEDKKKGGAQGATLERHTFCHTDRPEQEMSTSGHFIIGKFTDKDETVIELTGFQIPRGQTLFIPAGVIHTNNYLQGRWNTMLSLELDIDDVRMVKNGQGFSFKFKDASRSYPSSMTVSGMPRRYSTVLDGTHHLMVHTGTRQLMGVYKKEGGLTQYGRPVYKCAGYLTTSYLFYDSEGYWRIGYDYLKGGWNNWPGWVKSEKPGLVSIPKTGWKVVEGLGHPSLVTGVVASHWSGSWRREPNLTVVESGE